MGVTGFNRRRREAQAQNAEQERPAVEPVEPEAGETKERSKETTEPVHVGGGWYRVDGYDDPIQGRDNAIKAGQSQDQE